MKNNLFPFQPTPWVGAFMNEEQADLLLASSPEEFAILIARKSEDNPKFLFAGAAVDLALNGHGVKSEEFLDLAKVIWPSLEWSALQVFVGVYRDRPDALAPKALRILRQQVESRLGS